MNLFIPTVSEVHADGTKTVNVYDRKSGVVRSINVSAQEADEYIKTREEAVIKAGKKDILFTIGSVLFGTLAGFGVSFLDKVKTAGYSKAQCTLFGFLAGGIIDLLKEKNSSVAKVERKITEEFIAKNLNKTAE